MTTRIKFRNKTPKRRNDPKAVSRYQDHKPDLKEDFHSYCGYCHSHDRYRDSYYEVDHFVPKEFFEKKGTISPTDYSNLVYSCRICNNSKSNHWPSKSESLFHVEDQGFIDPCDEEYSEQFYRCDRGRIYPGTKLGQWMYITLKFHVREREIELVWQLERLERALEELEKEQLRHDKVSAAWAQIQEQIINAGYIYSQFDRDLKDFRNK
jgi:hypothetical protein